MGNSNHQYELKLVKLTDVQLKHRTTSYFDG